MSQEVVTFKENTGLQLAPEFMPLVEQGLTDELSEGVGGGFAVISIKAGRFRIKHKGNEVMIANDRGDPVGSIDTVILRANAHITKQWYNKQYSDGDSAAPDCFSLDGANPSPGSPLPQAKSCAACPKNVFGSAPPRDGVAQKAKACSDNRKLAVVPLDDMENESFGGPMLFRVPPSALQELAAFGQAWKARGYPYNAIAVRIGMDIKVSHPKPTFEAIRPLTSEEANKVLAMMHSPAVEKILNDFDAAAAQAPVTGPVFAEPQAEAQSRAAPPPAQPKPAPAPVAQVAAGTAAPAATFGKPKPAAPTQAAPAASATPSATFGKAKVTAAPAAAQAAPAATTAAKAVKPRAKPAAAPAPAPVAAEPTEEPAVVEDPSAGGSADADIENILAELGSVAGQ